MRFNTTLGFKRMFLRGLRNGKSVFLTKEMEQDWLSGKHMEKFIKRHNIYCVGYDPAILASEYVIVKKT